MKRLAVIGCGLRADCYLAQMREGFGKEWQIVAVADPAEKHRRFYKDHYSCKGAREYEDGMARASSRAAPRTGRSAAAPVAARSGRVAGTADVGREMICRT